jgi:hypothetical protein
MVTFENTKPDWILLKATFVLNGKQECAKKQIALVKVDVGTGNFTNPGRVEGSTPESTKSFLVVPPRRPATPVWVTQNDPGSDWAKFTYNGKMELSEGRVLIDSDPSARAFRAETDITLTSPPEKPDALQKIQVGFIQHESESGFANYEGGLKRTLKLPASDAIDWLSSPEGPSGSDQWPWYSSSASETGSGSGTWTTTLTMMDAPKLSIPLQYNPNHQRDPHWRAALTSASASAAFTVRTAARTLDTDLDADKHYFEQTRSAWTANYVWPVKPDVSIITLGGPWVTPGGPTEVSVNVVPAVIDSNPPFLRWEHGG